MRVSQLQVLQNEIMQSFLFQVLFPSRKKNMYNSADQKSDGKPSLKHWNMPERYKTVYVKYNYKIELHRTTSETVKS